MSIADKPPRARQLTPADLGAILVLQQSVLADLPPGFVRPRTERDWASYLDGTRGVAYGISAGAALAAASLLALPTAAEPGPSLDAEIATRGVVLSAGLRQRISDEDWTRATCFLGNAMVRREARGRGYQRALIEARLAHAAAAAMRWAFSGVHFGNAVSWRNLLAHGMAIAVVRGDPRHPMLGLIRGYDASAVVTDAGDRIAVAPHEPSRHQAALQDGYIGVRVAADGDVIYEKLLPAGTRTACSLPGDSPSYAHDPSSPRFRRTRGACGP